jgi:O-antigen/teichoic acid export membrane protein
MKLVGGTSAAQLITFAAAALLARLYAPADFGVLQLFTSATLVLSALATLRLDLAVMIPDHDDEAVTVVALGIVLVTVVALLAGTTGIVARLTWRTSPLPTLIAVAPLVSVSIWFGGVSQVLSVWTSRRGLFGLLSSARIVQAIVTATLQALGHFVWQTGSSGLVVGYAVGMAANLAVLLAGGRYSVAAIARALSRSRLRQVGRRFLNFSLVSSSGSLFDAGAAQLPPFVLGALFGNAVVGYYALAYRLLSAPLNLLGLAVAQVFYQAASARRADTKGVAELTATVFRRLLLFGGVPLSLIGVVGPQLFGLIFGVPWVESGLYARILTPWLLAQFLFSPLSYLFFVQNKQRLYLWFTLWQVGALGLALVAGGVFGSQRIAISALSLGGAVLYVVFLKVALRTAGLYLGRLVGQIRLEIGVGAFAIGALILQVTVLHPRDVVVVAMAGVTAVAYYVMLYAMDRKAIEDLTS